MPGFLLYLFLVADSRRTCHVAPAFAKRTKLLEFPILLELPATIAVFYLTAPATIPAMICFCKKKYRIRIGRSVSTSAAMMRP